MIHTSLSRGVP